MCCSVSMYFYSMLSYLREALLKETKRVLILMNLSFSYLLMKRITMIQLLLLLIPSVLVAFLTIQTTTSSAHRLLGPDSSLSGMCECSS